MVLFTQDNGINMQTVKKDLVYKFGLMDLSMKAFGIRERHKAKVDLY